MLWSLPLLYNFYKLSISFYFLQTPSKKKLEIMTISSNYHIEVNPSDVGIYDRVVIMDLVKTTAQTHQIDPSGQREFKGKSISRINNVFIYMNLYSTHK